MGLLSSLFGEREKTSPEVRQARMAMEPDGEIVQGELSRLKLKVKAPSGRGLRLAYMQFDLVNKREERKALFDKTVTSSRFIYRVNLDRELEAGSETEIEVPFLPPICREATRKSKFVTILWELAPSLYFAEPGSANSRAPFRLVGARQEVVLKGRR